MYILYWSRLSIGTAVKLALEELELEYEVRVVDTITGQHRKPEYLAVNPAGWIPSLITPEGQVLSEAPGIMLIDKREDEGYVTPVESAGDSATYVSRVRDDPTVDNGITLWCVSDNLRKGAALNAVQIAELLGRECLKKG